LSSTLLNLASNTDGFMVSSPLGSSSSDIADMDQWLRSPHESPAANQGSSSNPFSSPDNDCPIYKCPDTSLCDKLRLYTESGHRDSLFSSVEASEIELLRILKPYPLKAFDDVIKWVHKSRCARKLIFCYHQGNDRLSSRIWKLDLTCMSPTPSRYNCTSQVANRP